MGDVGECDYHGIPRESDSSHIPLLTSTIHHPFLTGLTGLEPATSGVTDRHSNQLSYSPLKKTASANS